MLLVVAVIAARYDRFLAAFATLSTKSVFGLRCRFREFPRNNDIGPVCANGDSYPSVYSPEKLPTSTRHSEKCAGLPSIKVSPMRNFLSWQWPISV